VVTVVVIDVIGIQVDDLDRIDKYVLVLVQNGSNKIPQVWCTKIAGSRDPPFTVDSVVQRGTSAGWVVSGAVQQTIRLQWVTPQRMRPTSRDVVIASGKAFVSANPGKPRSGQVDESQRPVQFDHG
jgi:hypothetical protein